jgi:23S rRNA (cytidine1920-2'-O)/16S rRNA (cytidine1409-2'-O)-methyltransferase
VAVRERLDVVLVQRGLADTRARAQALIRSGRVSVAGQREDKPGTLIPSDARVEVREPMPYVSRGGYKLAAALDAFGVDPRGLTCLDVGASTGGFTDVLLQRGARRVYAVDVGRGQLAWKLRADERVVSLERTDIRAVRSLPEPVDLAVADVAFISLRLVLPALEALLRPDGRLVALVKPQFEAGRAQVGRGGIVRDPAVHRQVLRDVAGWAAGQGWRLAGAARAAVEGASGNQEFLLFLGRPAAAVPDRSAEELLRDVGL